MAALPESIDFIQGAALGLTGVAAVAAVDAVIHLAGDPAALLPTLRPGGRFVSTRIASPDQIPAEDATVIAIYATPPPSPSSGLPATTPTASPGCTSRPAIPWTRYRPPSRPSRPAPSASSPSPSPDPTAGGADRLGSATTVPPAPQRSSPPISKGPFMDLGVISLSDIQINPATGRRPSYQQRIDEIVGYASLADRTGLDVFALGEHFPG